MIDTFCLICKKPQTACCPHVICDECRNPDTSTVEDFIAKLLKRLEELEISQKQESK